MVRTPDEDVDAEAEISPDGSSSDEIHHRALTEGSDTDETEPVAGSSSGSRSGVTKNRMIGPAVTVLPPFTGYKPDDEAEHAVESAPDEESV